jgi:5-methylcytosine-specific restriction endonuclease McrA
VNALLPEDTVPVPPAERDWDWAGNARKRRLLVRAVLAVKGRTCHLCGLPGATTADHLIPWSHGGRNIMDNLAPAHYSCNSARGNRTLRQWFAAHPLRTSPALTPSRAW